MARLKMSTKVTYVLAGAVVGATLILLVVLLKRREARAAEGAQMTARLEQVTG
jgi:Flp pilus assembly protein protease CpaA